MAKRLLLTIGDVHIKTSTIEKTKIFHTELEKLLQQKSYKYIILLGDILDQNERINSFCLNTACDLIHMCSNYGKTIVLVGNHDMINNSQFLTQNHWMNCLKQWPSVKIVDNGYYDDDFVFSPYVPNGRFVEALNQIDSMWRTKRAIFGHQEIKGCSMNAITSEHGDEWLEEYPLLISGHIHGRQTVGKNVVYVGSCMQHSFAETGNKTITEWDFTDTPKRADITFNVPRKYLTTVDDEATATNLKIEIKNPLDKHKVVIKCKSSFCKTYMKTKVYKDMIARGITVQFKILQEKMDVVGTEYIPFKTILKRLIEDGNQDLLKFID